MHSFTARVKNSKMVLRMQNWGFAFYEKVALFLLYLLVFQNPLEVLWEPFRYIDEIVAMLAIPCFVTSYFIDGKTEIGRGAHKIVISLTLFLLVGLIGNVIWQYQYIGYILIDVLTNIKFFLAVFVGYSLFSKVMNADSAKLMAKHLRFISTVLFVFFLIERIVPIFGTTEIRYGIRSTKLFYGHYTYLAAALVFVITALVLFYEKKNICFIVLDLVLMAFTLRGKAIACAAVFAAIFVFIVILKKDFKPWHAIPMVIGLVALGWDQISYYFIELDQESARSILTKTSLDIMWDYFPVGTGFGTFASHSAAVHYSPVYVKYGIDKIWGLWPNGSFLNDSFWPIIIGQTGLLGTVCYIVAQFYCFKPVYRLRKVNRCWFVAGIFVLVYLMVSSTSEPAFNNPIAIPLALVLGAITKAVDDGSATTIKLAP